MANNNNLRPLHARVKLIASEDAYHCTFHAVQRYLRSKSQPTGGVMIGRR